MTTVVIDASIAVKWVVEEDGTAGVITIRRLARLIAPELLIAECANILWKKVQRGELNSDEALLAARILQAAEIEFLPSRSLLEAATQIAIELKHAAYDCLRLALATERDCRFVTADGSFVRRLRERHQRRFRGRVIGVTEVARELSRPRSAGP